MPHRTERRTGIGTVGLAAAALIGALSSGGCEDETPDDPAAGGADWERFVAQGGDTTTAAAASSLVGPAPRRTRTIAALMFNIAKLPDGGADPAGVPNPTN